MQVNIGKNSSCFRKEVKKTPRKYDFWALIFSCLPREILKNGDPSPRHAWLLNSNSLTAEATTAEHVEKGEEQQTQVFPTPSLAPHTVLPQRSQSLRFPLHKFGMVILYLPKQL